MNTDDYLATSDEQNPNIDDQTSASDQVEQNEDILENDSNGDPEENDNSSKDYDDQDNHGMNVHINETDTVYNIEDRKTVNNNYRTYFFGSKEDGKDIGSREVLEYRHFEYLSLAELRREIRTGIYIPRKNLVVQMGKKLKQKSILLLYGPSDTGKGLLAYELAAHMSNVAEEKRIYVKSGMENELFLNPQSLLSENRFHHAILIIKDCFAWHNSSVMNLFQSKAKLKEVNKRLNEIGSFMILTSDKQHCHKLLENYKVNDILFPLSPITNESLGAGFEKLVNRALENHPFTDEQKERYQIILGENRQEIVKRLDKVSLIYHFLNFLCKRAYELRIELDLALINAELDRFNNLTAWFVKQISTSEIHWLWGISFVLAHAAPSQTGISYGIYERFRKLLFKIFVEEGLIKGKKLEAKILRMEGTIRDDFQAEMMSDGTTRERYIRFKDDSYVLSLWKVLFEKFLGTLYQLYPHLLGIASKSDIGFSSFVYTIIGRMSIGFPNETGNLVLGWVNEEENDYRKELSLGFIYQGILATEDKKHIDRFLNHLVIVRKKSARGVISAIGVYAQIGRYRLKPSVKALGDILRDRFGKSIESENQIRKLFNRAEQEISKHLTSWKQLKMFRKLTQLFIETIFNRNERDYEIVTSIQYSLVSLCLFLDVSSVFQELNKWMLPGKG